MTVKQRDEAALEALMNEVLDVYDEYMAPGLDARGISTNQARMSIRILIRREMDGDTESGALLDAFEECLREREANGPPIPVQHRTKGA